MDSKSAPSGIIHVAIPCADLEMARNFYVGGLGCRLARSYDDRITLAFFGHQLVCHLAPDEVDPEPRMYPRHFGFTFLEREAFDRHYATVRDAGLALYRELFTRFAGQPGEHRAFFLVDPSNNLLEFKHYADPAMIY